MERNRIGRTNGLCEARIISTLSSVSGRVLIEAVAGNGLSAVRMALSTMVSRACYGGLLAGGDVDRPAARVARYRQGFIATYAGSRGRTMGVGLVDPGSGLLGRLMFDALRDSTAVEYTRQDVWRVPNTTNDTFADRSVKTSTTLTGVRPLPQLAPSHWLRLKLVWCSEGIVVKFGVEEVRRHERRRQVAKPSKRNGVRI